MDGANDGTTVRDGDEELDGLPLDAAVERVDGDDGAAESALRLAAENGVVRWDALEDELATVSKVVATPETRLELATAAVADARAAADGLAEEPVVARRLDALDDRLASVDDDVTALASDLRDIAARTGEPGELYAVAADLQSLRRRANEQQTAADELIDDAETVERWLGSAEQRRREFDSDLDALATTVDSTESALARAEEGDDAAVEAAASHVVSGLLVADLRTELGTLREWPGEDGNGVDWGEAADRLAELETRREELDGRVDAVAGGTLADLDAAVGDPEPPIEWERVRAAVDGYRA